MGGILAVSRMRWKFWRRRRGVADAQCDRGDFSLRGSPRLEGRLGFDWCFLVWWMFVMGDLLLYVDRLLAGA